LPDRPAVPVVAPPATSPFASAPVSLLICFSYRRVR
jgi:hypothetical protein